MSLPTLSGWALVLVATVASAQSYPDRPIRVIVPVPAGGSPDVLARTVTPGISAALGQPLVIDNRGGAGGLIGAELAARAAPDGYTIFITSPGALTIVPHLQKVPYDTLKDFAPVGLVSTGAFVLLVHPSVAATTVKELITLAKSQPGKLTYGSGGNGTANHLSMESFKNVAGTDITHVPYKGAPLTLVDILAGRIDITMNQIPPVLAHIKEGRLRALGIGSDKRAPQIPNVPTISEAGLPGFKAGSWLGIVVPARTPQKIIAQLNAAMVKSVRTPQTTARLEELGAMPIASTPEEFGAQLRREWHDHAKIVKIAGAKVD